MNVCPTERHEKMKAHSLLVFLFMADYIGIQRDRHGTIDLVMANCPTCKTTLGFEPKPGEIL